MTVSRTSAEQVSFDTAISQAQKNISDAIGFIRNSSLKGSNSDFQDLQHSIQERIKKIKSVKLIDAENLSFEKTEGDKYKLLVPKTIASQNSYLVYRSLLSYFLEKLKQKSPERFNKYELNDLTSALTINTSINEETKKTETPVISFDDMVLQVLHDGPGPRPASELPPLVDNSYVDLTGGQKPNFDLKIVARLTGIYPDEKNNMVYWRPFADELNRAVTSNRKEDITKILTSVLNAFLFILTRPPQPKLPRYNEEGQEEYNKRVVEKIETDFLKFILKYINIRESGNQSLRPLFIQAIKGIRGEELDGPLASINFSDVLDKFNKAKISQEQAEIDQASLVAITDRDLANAPRISQSSTMGAARLGITDQSQGTGRTRVALIGGPQSNSSTDKKDSLIVDNNFYDLSDVYDFKFADLKQAIIKSLESAIQTNASDLTSLLPEQLDRYLDIALKRTRDPNIISPVKNEAKELLKFFANMLNSQELKELLRKNKIILSPQQFFLSQIFLKYFAQDSKERKEFYFPILRELEDQYAEFNGVTALIHDAQEQSIRGLQKGQRRKTEYEVEQIIQGRKTDRERIISSFAKNPKEPEPVLKIFESFGEISTEEIKKHIQSQGISSFIERLASYARVLKANELLINNNLEEYKLDFIELITGIKPLITLNAGSRFLGSKIPIYIGKEGKTIEKNELIALVKAIITRKLMTVVHADKKGEELTKLLPGVDNIPEIASELYEFLNSRQDLLDIGTAWSDQEFSKIESISQSVSHAVKQAEKYQEDQTVRISREREQKLEAAANSSINAQLEIQKLQIRVDTLTETLLEVLKMLAAQNRPSREELERLSFRIRDQSGRDTLVGRSVTETIVG